MWLLTDQSTIEFSSDNFEDALRFNATFSASNLSALTGAPAATCKPPWQKQHQCVDDVAVFQIRRSFRAHLSAAFASGGRTMKTTVTGFEAEAPRSHHSVARAQTTHSETYRVSLLLVVFGQVEVQSWSALASCFRSSPIPSSGVGIELDVGSLFDRV